MVKITVDIEGMACGMCEAHIKEECVQGVILCRCRFSRAF